MTNKFLIEYETPEGPERYLTDNIKVNPEIPYGGGTLTGAIMLTKVSFATKQNNEWISESEIECQWIIVQGTYKIYCLK